ncbi:MAG: hypothetical protein NVS3B12_20910 [Acidimicrobiales bacterium]
MTDVVVAFGALAVAVVGVIVVRLERVRILTALAQMTPSVSSTRSLRVAVTTVDRVLRAERAQSASLVHSQDRLVMAFALSPDAMVVCDELGTVVHRSDAAQAYVGARHGAALAEQAITELLNSALLTGPCERSIDLYGPPPRALHIRATPLVHATELIGAVAIIEDVSERRRLEAVRRDFVANVSHELKSPIGALGILAETMQAEDDREVSQRLAGRMHLEAFRVARIIDDLLDLSRIESEESPIREALPVRLVVGEAADRIRPVAEHRNVSIEVTEPPRQAWIDGDRRQLVSAVHNLLENAVKYSDAGSTVEVRARVIPGPGATVEITVRDYGIGIPTRDLERIFERFYRVDRARARETGGTGLGLAIVRHVATNHGGSVRVTSQEGEGSTFTLEVPATPGPDTRNPAGAG